MSNPIFAQSRELEKVPPKSLNARRNQWTDGIHDSELSLPARMVALIYAKFSWTQLRGMDRVYVTNAIIKKQSGIKSNDALNRARRQLIEQGWLVLVEESKWNRSAIYRMTLPGVADEQRGVSLDDTRVPSNDIQTVAKRNQITNESLNQSPPGWLVDSLIEEIPCGRDAAATLATDLLRRAKADPTTIYSAEGRLGQKPYRRQLCVDIRRQQTAAGREARKCAHGVVDGMAVPRGPAPEEASRVCGQCESQDPATDELLARGAESA